MIPPRGPHDELDPRFDEWHRIGERRVRNALVEDHMWLASFCASRFSHRGEARDDLAQVALFGLVNAVEEDVFYPWPRGLSAEIAEVVDEGVEEHHVVKVLLDEIAELDPRTDEWTAKLAVVIENVEHHAGEEETEMVPQVPSTADGNALDDVAADLEAKKAELGAPVLADRVETSTQG